MVLAFKDSPMSVPYFPIHTQGTEIDIQFVTKSAMMMYGQVKRDCFIRRMHSHRKIFPVIEDKKTFT